MRKKLIILLVIITAISFSGCLMNNDYTQIEQQITQLKTDISDLESQISELNLENSALREKKSEALEENSELYSTRDAIRAQVSAMTATNNKLNEKGLGLTFYDFSSYFLYLTYYTSDFSHLTVSTYPNCYVDDDGQYVMKFDCEYEESGEKYAIISLYLYMEADRLHVEVAEMYYYYEYSNSKLEGLYFDYVDLLSTAFIMGTKDITVYNQDISDELEIFYDSYGLSVSPYVWTYNADDKCYQSFFIYEQQ